VEPLGECLSGVGVGLRLSHSRCASTAAGAFGERCTWKIMTMIMMMIQNRLLFAYDDIMMTMIMMMFQNRLLFADDDDDGDNDNDDVSK
jgi:hypothetical protein